MELLGLSAGQLLGLLGAASALTVALYMLRLRRRRVAVPFIGLWEGLLQDRQSSRLFARLRHLLSLLLALLVVALISLALADPRPGSAAPSARHVVLLVDAGVTMRATDLRPSRLDAAIAEARKLTRGAGPGLRVLVAQMDGVTTPLSPMSSERHVLDQALAQVAPTDLATDHQRAYRFALDVLAGRPGAEIAVLSDAAVAPEPELAVQLDRARIALTHVPIGRRGDNAGIAAFAVRRYPLDKNRSELLIELYAASKHAEDVELTLLGDGTPIDVQRLRLEPGQTVRRVYDDVTGVARTVEARLTVPGDHDDLAADNRAYAALPDRRRSRVLCVTDGNLYLEAALLLDEYLDVDVVAPAAYRSADGYDAVIFDRFAPPAAPLAPALYLGLSASGGGPLETRGTVERPFFDRVDAKHRLLRFTALRDVNVTRAALVRPAASDQVLAADARAPLIVAGEREGHRFVAVTFDVRESDLPLRVAWPLLLLNVIDWFTGGEEGEVSSTAVGRSTSVELPADASRAVVRDPDGREREATVAGGRLVFTPQRAGFYRIAVEGGEERIIAVNLDERTRRDLTPRSRLVLGDAVAPRPAPTEPGLERPPWMLLAALSLLIVCGEWITYHRRWTV